MRANVNVDNLPSKIILIILFTFLLGAMLGYVIELLFRRFFSAKKWVNPGFMKGPWLPLYGFGLVIMFAFSWIILYFMPDNLKFYNPTGDLFYLEYESGPTIYDLIPISIMGCSMILLEFIAGVIFVKGFKVRLWDYTNMKGNIMGVICPVFSIIWFAVAIIFYYGLNPFIFEAFIISFNYLFGSNGVTAHFGTIFILGIIYGVFIIDLINSLGIFNKISKLSKESGVIAKYEKLMEEQKIQKEKYKEKIIDALPESIKNLSNKEKKKESSKNLSILLKKMILIDPNKNDTKSNYDENGRPIKEDTSK